MLRYLACEEKIAAIVAWCASDNIGSRRAMEKAGMVKVKAEKDALIVGDATFDKLWYEFRGDGPEKDA
ncbi:MAG: GNAT family N-acetyltransferase [Eggerthellaceae bacterium]|nr:GNAT family N-acetyltransferase [Eggerthellaceae bacterium]